MKTNPLDQLKGICEQAFSSVAKLNKSFKKFIIETMICYLSITRRVNFSQMARFSTACESRFRQNFKKRLDWVRFNTAFTSPSDDHLRAIAIGRFFSPDPFVQAPDFTQNYNRYSYCLNNPVMFCDPDGEIIGTIFGFVSDLTDNVFARTFKGEKWDWTQTKNGWEIDKSIIYTDPNKSFGKKVWECVSRFTWQLPQTLIGDLFVSSANALGSVFRWTDIPITASPIAILLILLSL